MAEREDRRLYPTGEPAGEQAGDHEGSEGWAPPRLFAWLASLATILLLVATLTLERGGNAYLRVAGVAVLVLSGVFIFAPFLLLSKHGRGQDGATYMRTETVVDRGLYALTRHPQYLGYMLLATGFALLSQHWLSILLAVAGVTCFYVQALREEKHCLAQLGEPYERYMRRVPRFNILLGTVRLLRRGRR